jgi:hypothetical protein
MLFIIFCHLVLIYNDYKDMGSAYAAPGLVLAVEPVQFAF